MTSVDYFCVSVVLRYAQAYFVLCKFYCKGLIVFEHNSIVGAVWRSPGNVCEYSLFPHLLFSFYKYDISFLLFLFLLFRKTHTSQVDLRVIQQQRQALHIQPDRAAARRQRACFVCFLFLFCGFLMFCTFIYHELALTFDCAGQADKQVLRTVHLWSGRQEDDHNEGP